MKIKNCTVIVERRIITTDNIEIRSFGVTIFRGEIDKNIADIGAPVRNIHFDGYKSQCE